MPWVRFDDQFSIHHKVDCLTDAAFRLHVSAIFWCARNLTDGHVAAEKLRTVVRMRKPLRYVAELVESGLWSEVDGGWQIHDYLEYQPSRAKVERERQAKAERQARWLAKKRRTQDASVDASQDAAPSPPRRKRGTGVPRAGASGPAGPAVRAMPPWCGECDSDTYRWVDTGDDEWTRCPRCHPESGQDTA